MDGIKVSRDHIIIHKCRKCGTFLIADTFKNKTRKCTSCNYTNKLDRVVIIQRFSSMHRAQNALRYLKIPREMRGEIPYLLYSTLDDVQSQENAARAFMKSIKPLLANGMKTWEVKRKAIAQGLDWPAVERILVQMRENGEIVLDRNHELHLSQGRY
ncbi:hypothetical protein GF325_02430 [Candidatus Bathyarchaeota archaeon]|nr:hypothetical protein [Candidatus Bathyarchaeota archaeon]